MMKTQLIRLLVSVVVGCAVVGGAASARAEGREAGMVRAEGYDLELADELFTLAEERCDYASQGWLESGIAERDVQKMYDACMRLSVPVWVTGLSTGEHYDVESGRFWKVAP